MSFQGPIKSYKGMYYITYKNEGRPEKVPAVYKTRKEALRVAEFLKLQGATSIRIHKKKGLRFPIHQKPENLKGK